MGKFQGVFFLWINDKCLIKLKAVNMSSVTIVEGFLFFFKKVFSYTTQCPLISLETSFTSTLEHTSDLKSSGLWLSLWRQLVIAQKQFFIILWCETFKLVYLFWNLKHEQIHLNSIHCRNSLLSHGINSNHDITSIITITTWKSYF